MGVYFIYSGATNYVTLGPIKKNSHLETEIVRVNVPLH